MKRSVILILCVVLALSASTLGTLAYLTDSDATVNTFAIGNVEITVDETEVTPDGKPTDSTERVKSNTYHLIPGMSYTKDPTLTVHKGSSSAYVRMLVTLDKSSELKAIKAFGGEQFELENLAKGWQPSKWIFHKSTEDTKTNTITYEYRYYEPVDASVATNDIVLEPLFTSFVIPATVTGEELLTIENLEIRIYGHAIQSKGFDNAQEAWTAFDQQTSNGEGDSE